MDHKIIIVIMKLLCQILHQFFTTAQRFHTVHSLGFGGGGVSRCSYGISLKRLDNAQLQTAIQFHAKI